jgi:hypothetical protein
MTTAIATAQPMTPSPTSIAELPSNLAILKMENESIQALAAVRPRDFQAIKDELEKTLDAFPALADEAIYSKPVGKVIDIKCGCGHQYEAPLSRAFDAKYPCPRCYEENGKPQGAKPRQKFARGLSIDAAETLAEAYGFNRVRADVTELPDGGAKIEGTFCDFQRGRIWQDSGIVPLTYTDRGGRSQKHPTDRFWSVIVKAEKSRIIREVITRSVNAGLKAWFEDKCQKIQATLLTEDKLNEIVSAFGQYGVTLPMIEAMLGRPKSVGWTTENRMMLRQVYSGMKSGEISVADAFGEDAAKQVATASAAAAKKANGKKTAAAAATPVETLQQQIFQATTDELVQAAAKAVLEADLTDEVREQLHDLLNQRVEQNRAEAAGQVG